jgi:hypothetical protein
VGEYIAPQRRPSHGDALGRECTRSVYARVAATALLVGLVVACLGVEVARADSDESDQAKLAQNPVANLISVPFQDNIGLNEGPGGGALNILDVEPVIPIAVNNDWNIITRTIVPVVSAPSVEGNRINGIGDTIFTPFLSPAHTNGWIWGVGPEIQAPTHSNTVLGNNNWGVGPSFVILHLAHDSPWLYGVLINNIWSVGRGKSPAFSSGLIEPFVDYNLRGGWYLVSNPIITVDWKAPGSQQWTVPLGGGAGKIVHFGLLPINVQLSAYYSVVRPTLEPNWQLRVQVQLLFPT